MSGAGNRCTQNVLVKGRLSGQSFSCGNFCSFDTLKFELNSFNLGVVGFQNMLFKCKKNLRIVSQARVYVVKFPYIKDNKQKIVIIFIFIVFNYILILYMRRLHIEVVEESVIGGAPSSLSRCDQCVETYIHPYSYSVWTTTKTAEDDPDQKSAIIVSGKHGLIYHDDLINLAAENRFVPTETTEAHGHRSGRKPNQRVCKP